MDRCGYTHVPVRSEPPFFLCEGMRLTHPELSSPIRVGNGALALDGHVATQMAVLLELNGIDSKNNFVANGSFMVEAPGKKPEPLASYANPNGPQRRIPMAAYKHPHQFNLDSTKNLDFSLPNGLRLTHGHLKGEAEIWDGCIYFGERRFGHLDNFLRHAEIPLAQAYKVGEERGIMVICFDGSETSLANFIDRQQIKSGFTAVATQLADEKKPDGYHHRALRINRNDHRDFFLPEATLVRGEGYDQTIVVKNGTPHIRGLLGSLKNLGHLDKMATFFDYRKLAVKLPGEKDWISLKDYIDQQEAETKRKAEIAQGKGGFFTTRFGDLPVIVPTEREAKLPQGVTTDILKTCIDTGVRHRFNDRLVGFQFDAAKAQVPAGVKGIDFGRLWVFIDHSTTKNTVTFLKADFATNLKNANKLAPYALIR